MLNGKNKVLNMTGKVQGVFYRASAYRIANEIGIVGYVKNMPNGSVLIEAEGSEEQLNRLIEWCTHGPPNAVVNEVKIKDGTLIGFTDFTIRY